MNDLESSYYRNTTSNDRKCIDTLLECVLKHHHKVHIFEGEDWLLLNADDIDEIKDHLARTSENTIKVRDHLDYDLGEFHLVYDHAKSDDPMEVIADHSDNDYCNQIWSALNAKFDNNEHGVMCYSIGDFLAEAHVRNYMTITKEYGIIATDGHSQKGRLMTTGPKKQLEPHERITWLK